MEVLLEFKKTLEKLLDIAMFSEAEKGDFVRELLGSLLLKTFLSETNSLSKEKDEKLAYAIRNATTPETMMEAVQETFDSEQYENTLRIHAISMLKKFVQHLESAVDDNEKEKFENILGDFTNFLESKI